MNATMPAGRKATTAPTPHKGVSYPFTPPHHPLHLPVRLGRNRPDRFLEDRIAAPDRARQRPQGLWMSGAGRRGQDFRLARFS